MVFTIGLTGGAASGKTTTREYFAQLGVPTICADIINHEILTTNSEIKQIIKNKFKTLDKKIIKKIILDDNASRMWLEELLHPLIRNKISQQIQTLNTTQHKYCVIEIPLLMESDFYQLVNRILVVYCKKNIQIQRLEKYKYLPSEQAKQLLNIQFSHAERQNFIAQHQLPCDWLENNGSIIELQQKISKLHDYYLNLSQNR